MEEIWSSSTTQIKRHFWLIDYVSLENLIFTGLATVGGTGKDRNKSTVIHLKEINKGMHLAIGKREAFVRFHASDLNICVINFMLLIVKCYCTIVNVYMNIYI